MKNKKGFTTIEIVISLTIILLISGTFIGVNIVNNKKRDKKVLEVTNKILEAANVYFSINKELDSTIEKKYMKVALDM